MEYSQAFVDSNLRSYKDVVIVEHYFNSFLNRNQIFQ